MPDPVHDQSIAVGEVGQFTAIQHVQTLIQVPATRTNTESPDLVVDPRPDNLPPRLHPDPKRPPLFREDRLRDLVDMFRRREGVRTAVGLAEPPGAGKTTLLKAFATQLATEPRDANTLAILHVDFSTARRPLRAVDNALTGRLSNSAMELTSNEDADDQPDSPEAGYVQIKILRRIGRRSLIAVFDRVEEVAAVEEHLRELRSFLEGAAMDRAFQVLEIRGETLAALPAVARFPIAPYTPAQSCEFLAGLGQPLERAAGAVQLLRDYDRLLQPGPLETGAVCCDPATRLPEQPAPDALELALKIEEAAGVAVGQVVERLCKLAALEIGDVNLSLQAMAVFGGIEILPAVRRSADIPTLPLDALQRLGWAEGDARLAGFALQALRVAAKRTFAGAQLNPNAAQLRAKVAQLALSLLDNLETQTSQALDGAVAWLERHAPGETVLLARLKAMLVQESQTDSISAFTPAEERLAIVEFQAQGLQGDLEAAMAALALHARGASAVDTPPTVRLADFTAAATAVATLLKEGAVARGSQLIAFDVALYLGSRRYHAFEEAKGVRELAFSALAEHEADALARQDLVWLVGWLSYLLNLADETLGQGERDAAKHLVERSSSVLARADWWQADSRKHRLLARLALLRERMAANAEEGRLILLEAVNHAADATRASPDDMGGLRYFIRVVQRLVRSEKGDVARQVHVDWARKHLESLLGDPDFWRVEIRAQFAALMRLEGKRAWNQIYQKRRAEEALRLLRTSRPDGPLEVEASPTECLVQARLQALLGQRDAARASCETSLALAPSPAAWLLKLRLLDGDEETGARSVGASSDEGEPGPAISKPLRHAIKAFREWAKQQPDIPRAYGQVDLWIIRREWREEGSLERAIARRVTNAGDNYQTLPREEKVELFKSMFRKREGKLAGIEGRFPSIAAVLARAKNQSQYVRSFSVATNEPPDCMSVLKIFDEGLSSWKGSHILLYHKAEYYRYIWNTSEAISALRVVVESATDGDLRRQAAATLCRTLHAHALHAELSTDERTAILLEAKRHVADLLGATEHADEIAILQDHIALELGEPIDWNALDAAYSEIVGEIHGFPTTLIREFRNLQSDTASTPHNLSEVLHNNYADSEVLGLAGELYLRRAEKQLGNNTLSDLEHAAGFFCATSVLERTWEGHERALTSFRLGRTILAAAGQFHDLNPLPGFRLDGKQDQVAWAEARFSSAVSRSTGILREASRDYQGRAARLRTRLALGRPERIDLISPERTR